MRNFYLLLVFLFSFGTVFAQQELSKEEQERREKNIQAGNPFAKFGYKAKVATLSKGKYLEVHDLDSIVTIGSVRYHVDNKKIVGFIPKDTTGNMYARPTMDTPSRWLSPDPLMEEFPDWSPYNYVMNNPINMIDPDGLYPRPILTYDPKLGLYGGYRFTESATHLLSLVSGVDKAMIKNAIVQERKPGQYRPFYSANKGGGAIVIGGSSYSGTITYTENWFEDDNTKYGGNGFGQDIKRWLRLSSHEVGHLPQINEAGGIFSYLGEFIKQYAQSGHDGAKWEIEADKGSDTFTSFNNFIDNKYGKDTLIKIFEATEENDGRKGTESYKINQIDKFWKEYETHRNETN